MGWLQKRDGNWGGGKGQGERGGVVENLESIVVVWKKKNIEGKGKGGRGSPKVLIARFWRTSNNNSKKKKIKNFDGKASEVLSLKNKSYGTP